MSSTALGSGDIVAERYRIDSLLGQGGMGSVYRAVQLSMGRSVALKLLAPEQSATREHVERFEREAQSLARLQHPSTVRLFDFGMLDAGRPFIVMELLAGADLQEELGHNGPMRWDQALSVCREVLGSLGEAHELGIIHRDIKPANVYLCAGGVWPSVKLLDFGIAGCVELTSTHKLTATGTVLGSAPYMSPEQAQGQPVGPAADLYALGVVLFEMLTGRTPFEGRGFTAQLLAKVLEPAPGLLEACPALALPAGVCELVGELLERDASRRPSSARSLGERMGGLLEGARLPPLARRLPRRESQPPLARTEPMLVPRTIADGWVPPSAPSASVAPSRRRALPLFLSALALPALAALWWPRELHEAVTVAGSGPGPLVALAAPGPVEPSDVGLELPPSVAEPGLGDPSGPVAPAPEAAEGAPGEGGARPANVVVVPPEAASLAPSPVAANAAGGGPRRARRPRPEAPAEPAPRGPSGAPGAAASNGPGVFPKASAPTLEAPAAPSLEARPAPVPSASSAPSVEPRPASSVEPRPWPSFEAPAAQVPSGPPAWVEPAPLYEPLPAPPRSPRSLLRRYRSVATAREAARAGEITPDERNLIIAELRQLRQRERARAVREYRAGYIGRGDLRARLREIDRRYDGPFDDHPPAGIHVWP